jgi:glycosyltransferase involved in cell wall biosynthesis
MSKRIDQLVAGYARGDAISQEVRMLRDVLHQLGYASDIFVPEGHIAPDAVNDCHPLAHYDPGVGEGVILHYSTSSPVNDAFAASTGRRILKYHNITPAEFFDGYDDDVAAELREARAGLEAAVSIADEVWSDSAYNASELTGYNVKKSKVLHLLFRSEEFDGGKDPSLRDQFDDDLTNWLFVGRLAPNKCVEELILAYAWYYHAINKRSRLLVVGSEYSCPRYYAMLSMLTRRLALPNVCFLGYVYHGRATLYDCADVFMMASRHEGYCLPLVEAMALGTPVIARRAGGMPEAMGNAGVMFDNLSPAELATLAHRVCSDPALRQDVLSSQQMRLEEIGARDVKREVSEILGVV